MNFSSIAKEKINCLIQTKIQDDEYLLRAWSSLIPFINQVLEELNLIKITFPNYTPHDEKHILNLYHLLDIFIDEEKLDSLPVNDLILLNLGIIAHDWGMAITESEKRNILNSYNNSSCSDYYDEKKWINAYINAKKIDFSKFCSDDKFWLDYVRFTHHERSASRILNSGLLDPINEIKRPLSLICLAHGLEFYQLNDRTIYSKNFPVLRVSEIDIAALSIYIRLLDRFDIAADRAIYALWQFVDPENVDSFIHWQIHQAINPISPPSGSLPYTIHIYSETIDPKIYSKLCDLRNLCIEEFDRSRKFLTDCHSKYHLNIGFIEWELKSDGFKETNIRFEFDRKHILSILHQEIYDKDPYVCLRELLQNSIDAVRTKKFYFEKKHPEINYQGFIQVEIEEDSKGLQSIKWIDNGTGISEFILENFFSKVGVSYYKSDFFENLNLNHPMISKYGIGILSCFMISDAIEIRTLYDKKLESFSSEEKKLLHIIIDNEERFFTVYFEDCKNEDGFTEISLKINPEKVNRLIQAEKLLITGYLKKILGFLEIPIQITENGKTTVIVDNVNQISNLELPKKIDNVVCNDVSYPLNKLIYENDISKIREFIQEIVIDVYTDLKINYCEGKIIILLPKEQYDLSVHYSKIYIEEINKKENSHYFFLKNRGLIEEREKDDTFYNINSCKSSLFKKFFSLGILVPRKNLENSIETLTYSLQPFFYINLKNNDKLYPNISRYNLINEDILFCDIQKAVYNRYYDIIIQNLHSQDEFIGLYQIYRIICYIFKPFAILLPDDLLLKIPIPALRKKEIITFNLQDKSCLLVLPEELLEGAIDKFTNHILQPSSEYLGYMNNWNGEGILFESFVEQQFDNDSLNAILSLHDGYILENYHTGQIKLLYPPFENYPPLLQPVLFPVLLNEKVEEQLLKLHEIIEKIISSPTNLEAKEISQLNYYLRVSLKITSPEFVFFPSGYDNYFGYGIKYLNVSHQKSKLLLQLFKELINSTNYDLINKINTHHRFDFDEVWDESNKIDYNEIKEDMISFYSTCKDYGLNHSFDMNMLIPLLVPLVT
ncbi:ATP-binding protein [Methanospirillum sp. J.3.6.1-F.2.7.3]|uniref:ATP-binding protein n=1 Tax=Methanospirillum purgamenti TaxID=2834276 RepID=A0A8E7EKI8_9EURY|nr:MULTISPECIES: ATP-binding protein [Methanospirillum]MDX8551561.1 ATP-binding protein [Methanospirillum hungatei]QVV90239.1 ATP-binding protein [Methanospirillum sp. J.3.6.1-F.2.7.3]